MHNWTKGFCKTSELEVARQRPLPHILVQMHAGIIFTVDANHGLRAWSSASPARILASTSLEGCPLESTGESAVPTALAVDRSNTDYYYVAVGTSTGHVALHFLDRENQRMVLSCLFFTGESSAISAIALFDPYLLSLNESRSLRVVHIARSERSSFRPARVLLSLKSAVDPVRSVLSIRQGTTSIVASWIYVLPVYPTGWSINLQELHLTVDGVMVQSRLASTNQRGTCFAVGDMLMGHDAPMRRSPQSRRDGAYPGPRGYSTTPMSLSYAHPFILCADDSSATLHLHLVRSNQQRLKVRHVRELWHCSSPVLGGVIGERGKAVTVARGPEVLAWNTEVDGRGLGLGRGPYAEAKGVRIRPQTAITTGEKARALASYWQGRCSPLASNLSALSVVGFDDERVVMLGEQAAGTDVPVSRLIMYDFT